MKRVIGVDPGVSGALAIYWGKQRLRVYDLMSRAKKSRGRELDGIALAELLEEVWTPGLVAYVEHVSAMPTDGGVSGFNFGVTFGKILQVLDCNRVPTTLVRPDVWKRAMGCGANKDSSLLQCLKRFGDKHRNVWYGERMGEKYDRCEAALIAAYGWEKER